MADVLNPTGSKFVQYDRWITRLLSSDVAPTLPIPVSEVVTKFSAERVVQSAGGATLDSASLKWKVVAPLINRATAVDFAFMVEVYLPDGTTRLHMGDYVTESEAVNAGGENLTAESQLRKWHFGSPWTGQLWHDTRTGTDVAVNYPPIFNPTVDEVVLGNRSNKLRLDNGNAFIWCHSEQVVTEKAETYAGQLAEMWTLKDAVAAMCWEMNGAEKFIDNPITASLAKLDGAPPMEDIKLSWGLSLPQVLDQLLHPFGFNWFIDYDLLKCRIEFFKIGEGPEKQLLFQAPGSVLDLALSNCNDYSVSRKIGDVPNSVFVLGDFQRREITIELVRSWPEADDSLTVDDLKKSETASMYKAKPHVWRRFVANEAGDYNGLRPEIVLPPRLDTVFDNYVPHRRNIEDPITYDAADDKIKASRQIHLEWSSDDGTTWEIVPPAFGQPFILPDQIGVLFTGDTPPTALVDAGSTAKVRITGTVAGDVRLFHLAPTLPSAANGREVILTLDLPDKFQDLKVQQTGDFKSSLAGHVAGADEHDDSAEITKFAEDIRDQNTCAELDCRFVLPGIHLDYKIGDQLTKISGREIDLDMCGSGGTPRYPQIIRREFSFTGSPTTILTVDRTTGRRK